MRRLGPQPQGLQESLPAFHVLWHCSSAWACNDTSLQCNDTSLQRNDVAMPSAIRSAMTHHCMTIGDGPYRNHCSNASRKMEADLGGNLGKGHAPLSLPRKPCNDITAG